MADGKDKVRAKVVGTCEIGGVAPGGTVELDPAEINIPALVEAGHIEIPKNAGRAAPSGPEA